MATHSRILAWEIPWTGGQRSLAETSGYGLWSHKGVGHDSATKQQHQWREEWAFSLT